MFVFQLKTYFARIRFAPYPRPKPAVVSWSRSSPLRLRRGILHPKVPLLGAPIYIIADPIAYLFTKITDPSPPPPPPPPTAAKRGYPVFSRESTKMNQQTRIHPTFLGEPRFFQSVQTHSDAEEKANQNTTSWTKEVLVEYVKLFFFFLKKRPDSRRATCILKPRIKIWETTYLTSPNVCSSLPYRITFFSFPPMIFFCWLIFATYSISSEAKRTVRE